MQIMVGNLPPDRFGVTIGRLILIDSSAAGRGWFLDPTAGFDEEFVSSAAGEELATTSSGPAAGRIDLLTVVAHEMGHVLGLPDLVDGRQMRELMAATLDTGIRRLPDSLADWLSVYVLPDPRDTNSDRLVSPLDALFVINFLNAFGATNLSSDSIPQVRVLDVNLDLQVSAADVLIVVNHLNGSRLEGAGGEGEAGSDLDAPTARFAALAGGEGEFGVDTVELQVTEVIASETAPILGADRRDVREADPRDLQRRADSEAVNVPLVVDFERPRWSLVSDRSSSVAEFVFVTGGTTNQTAGVAALESAADLTDRAIADLIRELDARRLGTLEHGASFAPRTVLAGAGEPTDTRSPGGDMVNRRFERRTWAVAGWPSVPRYSERHDAAMLAVTTETCEDPSLLAIVAALAAAALPSWATHDPASVAPDIAEHRSGRLASSREYGRQA
jgi:hypothetical protein